MKHITISFEINDNYSDKSLLYQLAISVTLAHFNANAVTITHPIKGTSNVYNLANIRRNVRRFPQATDEGDAL